MKILHILNPFENPFGGSELRALDLHARLKGHADVRLWSLGAPAEELARRAGIRPVDISSGIHPLGGTLVIVGAYFQAEVLFPFVRPQRVIYIFNTPSPNLFRMRRELVRQGTGLEPEIVYASEEGAQLVGLPGRVEPSPIDVERFWAARKRMPKRDAAPFVLGRHSRDVPEKHHPEDAEIYRRAVARGWGVRLMGGTCLAGRLDPAVYRGVDSLACGTQSPEDFLAGLDCFFYRVSDDWTEAFGRVVLEAMAAGLPVVCDRKIGAAGLIEPGVTGFVTTDTDEALAALERLAADPALRERIGEAAHRKAAETYSEAFTRDLVDYYLP